MDTTPSHHAKRLSRRHLLKAGLAAGVTLSTWPLTRPKPPVNGRELVAEDVKFTFDRFLTEKGNADRYILESVDRIEVVERYTVKFLLKEPYVWLFDVLANPRSMWLIAPEVVEKFGDLKQAEHAIGTGPFILERYEPNVKTVFKRNPDYFLPGQPYIDGVEWVVVDDDVGLEPS